MVDELEPGMLVGRYRLLRRIAQGGMGSVWAARDERLEREVAIKLLPRILVTDPSAERRFEREARAMGRLQHANVVSIFDVGRADPGTGEELPFLVMELISGTSLDKLLADGPLAPERAIALFEQVASALAAAHKAGIVHRDLKPSNIMVDDEGHVKVLDFGLARILHYDGHTPEDTLTTPGMVLGSCPYMAPEQALGHKVTPASDVFSSGAVLYQALSGVRPFDGETPLQVLQAVVRCQPRPLREVAPEIDRELADVVARCMSREPDERYPSAAELGRDLGILRTRSASAIDETPTLEVRSGSARTMPALRRRATTLWAAATGAALVAGALAGLVAGRVGTEARRPDPGRWSVREVLSLEGSLRHPSWRPDGGELLVEHELAGVSRVLAVPLDGGEPRELLRGGPGENLGWPAYSPDGRALVVTVVRGESETLKLFPAVGGPELLAVNDASHATWLDADHLLFTRFAGDASGVWACTVDGREERRLVAAEPGRSWWLATPRPGGGFALLGGASDVRSGVYVVASVDREPREWLDPGRNISGVQWSSSGRSLVSAIEGELVRLTAAGPRTLLPATEALDDPALSPGGEALAVTRTRRTNELVTIHPEDGHWACRLCGVERTSFGSVGPAGEIGFGRYTSGGTALFVRTSDGAERRLTRPGESATCPSFSPDGDRVAYLATEEGRPLELRVVARSGGRPVTLASRVEGAEYASWSPDGRYLAYAGGSPTRVWVVSAGGGEPRELTPDGGDYPRWSPDGETIAYVVWTEVSDPSQGAWVVAAAGGEPRMVSPFPTQLGWSLDGRLLWQLRRSGETLELWEAEAGRWQWRRRSVLDVGTVPPPYMEHLPFTVDPVSGALVLNRRRHSSSLLVFEGLRPELW